MRTARVLVVHTHRIVAEAISRRLDAESGIRTVEMCASAPAAQSAANALGPDVAVVEVSADDRTALDLIAWLVDRDPSIAVAAILSTHDLRTAIKAIRAGASAVVTSDSSADELVDAIVSVAADHAFVSRHLLAAVLFELRTSAPAPNEYDDKLARLTPREREVLEHLVAGRDRPTIARAMRLSIDTVRTHTRNILAKLGVHSSLEAVSVARRGNLRAWHTTALRAEAHG